MEPCRRRRQADRTSIRRFRAASTSGDNRRRPGPSATRSTGVAAVIGRPLRGTVGRAPCCSRPRSSNWRCSLPGFQLAGPAGRTARRPRQAQRNFKAMDQYCLIPVDEMPVVPQTKRSLAIGREFILVEAAAELTRMTPAVGSAASVVSKLQAPSLTPTPRIPVATATSRKPEAGRLMSPAICWRGIGEIGLYGCGATPPCPSRNSVIARLL